MSFIDKVYNKYYLPTIINRRISIRKNKNHEFSLLCGNCMGGYIYHQLGMPFLSPTINLMILQPDFYKLILNPEHYLQLDILECAQESNVPCGKIDDITIYFTHYSSFVEGARSWKKRAMRVNYNNLYIIASDRDGIIEEQIYNLKNVKCKKLVVFTAKKYQLPYCFWLPEYEDNRMIGNILGKTLSGKWKFEKFFDYVAWLNSTDVVAEHFRIG